MKRFSAYTPNGLHIEDVDVSLVPALAASIADEWRRTGQHVSIESRRLKVHGVEVIVHVVIRYAPGHVPSPDVRRQNHAES